MADQRPEPPNWIERLLNAYAREILDRSLRVQCEFDPRFQIAKDERLEAAVVGLFRFVLSSVPDGCEVYFASARSLAPVAALESGSLTLRWQVAGDEPGRRHDKVTALRPIVGSARTHVQSRAAIALRDDFGAAGWNLELFAMTEDEEMWACATTV